jgi:anti-sigma factor RsiW
MGAVLTVECERARTWASLGLDGELSQVEQALLRAHVGRCAACAEFARDLDGLTQELRRAPLERPAAEAVPERRRHSGRRMLQLGAAAAAVVLAAAFGSLAGSLTSEQPTAAAVRAAQFPMHGFRIAWSHPNVLPGTRMQKSTPV